MEIKELLENKYSSDMFESFILDRFSGSEIRDTTYTDDGLSQSEKQHIENYKYLCKVDLDGGQSIGFFEFRATTENIENKRVGYSAILKKLASEYILDGAIASFYHKDSDIWRLSFVGVEYDSGRANVTNLKRYTYLLGQGIPTKTALQQLKDLKYPKFNEIQNAFSVEAIGKEFFEEYKKLFEKLNLLLTPQMALFGTEENLHAFSKKLLGRIVFIYFLQKKGWLGVKSEWGDGEKNFLELRYKDAPKDFYTNVLNPLFFDTLNLKRTDDYSELFKCKIPFLNGGLFDKNSNMDDNIFIDDGVFGDILSLFGSYNFTIIEDTTDDIEVAIDPEMLGRVFENLLEENYRKGKGAFYTPREIVSYMCESSISHYIDNATKEYRSRFGVDEFLEHVKMSGDEICQFYLSHPQKYIVIENYFESIKPYKNIVINFRIVAKLKGFIKEKDKLVRKESYGGHADIDYIIWRKILKKEYAYHSHIIGSNKEIKINNETFIYPTIIKYIQIEERFFALAFLPNIYGDLELNTIFPIRERNIKSKTRQQEKTIDSWLKDDFAFNKTVLEELKSLWRDCHSPHTVLGHLYDQEHNTASRFSMISHKLFNINSLTNKILKKHLSTKWYELKLNKILNDSTIPQKDLKELMLEKLKAIKVLDPAIGSGAFPMGMLHEIVQTRITLGDKTPHAQLKRDIIENSIYGVDIDGDAVEIAKLRFWLSLTVDEDTPSPLPNLDFKIMQGNSLVETINGFEIIPSDIYEQTVKKPKDLFSTQEQTLLDEKLFDTLVKKIHEFYGDTTGAKKKSDKEEIKSLINEVIKNYLDEQYNLYKHNEKELSSGKVNVTSKKKISDTLVTLGDNIDTARRVLAELLKNNFQTKELFLYKLFFGEVLKKGGFDVVIGNPPYIRQEKIKELKPKLQIEGYKSYNGTADIYVYFFEQGYRLLKDGGSLSFITSNKYTRAKYGKEFRDFVLKNTDILEYIDFNGVKVFESATVDTSILSFRKRVDNAKSKFLYCDVKSDYKGEDLSDYCQKNGFLYAQNDLTLDSFSFANPKELEIKKKIEAIGTPLKEWDIKIYRGVLTGFNEAFIISQEKRDELVGLDPKSAEIIKPMLRGRDIKRYGYEFAGLYLLYIPWEFELDKYPIIKEHLKKFQDELSKRPEVIQCRFPWYALSRYASAYWQEFEKEKIIWMELSDAQTFTIDNNAFYVNKTLYVMTGNNLKFLTAILNSKIIFFYYNTITTSSGVGTTMWQKINIERLPIPKISQEEQQPFEILVDKIMELKAQKQDTQELENQIDEMVYELYGLSEDEIKVVEGR